MVDSGGGNDATDLELVSPHLDLVDQEAKKPLAATGVKTAEAPACLGSPLLDRCLLSLLAALAVA